MKKLILTTLTLFISSAIVFAQEETEKDILITDEIIVVKPYTPKVSDAFKLKDNPSLEDENIPKDSVNYTIILFPLLQPSHRLKEKHRVL